MATFLTEDGKLIWRSEESKPATHVGNPQTQADRMEIRQERTILCTARAMQLNLTPEELDEVIAKNASTVEMDPDELRELSTRYLERSTANSNGIEKE